MNPKMVAPPSHPESGLRLRQEETLQLLEASLLPMPRHHVLEEGVDVNATVPTSVSRFPVFLSEDAFPCASSGGNTNSQQSQLFRES